MKPELIQISTNPNGATHDQDVWINLIIGGVIGIIIGITLFVIFQNIR